MCAAFWPDILVIISLGRYLYMLCHAKAVAAIGGSSSWGHRISPWERQPHAQQHIEITS